MNYFFWAVGLWLLTSAIFFLGWFCHAALIKSEITDNGDEENSPQRHLQHASEDDLTNDD